MLVTSLASSFTAGVSPSFVSSRFLNSTHLSLHFGQRWFTSRPRGLFVKLPASGAEGMCRERQNHRRHCHRDHTTREARSRGNSGVTGTRHGSPQMTNRWVPWCEGKQFGSHHLSCNPRSSETPCAHNQRQNVAVPSPRAPARLRGVSLATRLSRGGTAPRRRGAANCACAALKLPPGRIPRGRCSFAASAAQADVCRSPRPQRTPTSHSILVSSNRQCRACREPEWKLA